MVSEGEVPDGDDRALEEARALLLEASIDGEVQRQVIDRGADWSVLLLTLGGVFLLGDKVEKNLVAWAAIVRRFVELLERLKGRFGSIRVDEEGALLIALSDLYAAEPKAQQIRQLSRSSLPFRHALDRTGHGLASVPDQLHVLGFSVDSQAVWLYGIKSTGVIVIRERFATEWTDF